MGDPHHDNCIFALATLLSSTLVYNALSAINEDTLGKLNFVAEISKHIRTKTNDGGSDSDFDFFFPFFIFAVRDFNLTLEKDGRPVSSDEYLEDCLQLQKGDSDVATRCNRPRLCIRKYFKNRKCFTFDRPGGRAALKKLETLTDDALSEDFVKEVKEFVEYVYGNCPVMRLETRQAVSGRMYAHLVKAYVDAIRDGAVPCVEDAVTYMAKFENEAAIAGSLELYREAMSSGLQLPTRTDKELSDIHFTSQQRAFQHFVNKAVMDKDNAHQTILCEKMETEKQSFIQANNAASTEKCRNLLSDLEADLIAKLKNGDYAKSGGFAEFREDLHRVQAEYETHQDLGVQKDATLLVYLQEKNQDSDVVLAADQKVSAEEKKAEAERQIALDAERQKEFAQREARLAKEHAEQAEITMQENLRQMQETNERQQMEMQEHFEQVMKQRLTEQQRLLTEGFREESNKMKAEMIEARQEYERDVQAQREEAERREQTFVEEMAKMREDQARNMQAQQEAAQQRERQYAEDVARMRKDQARDRQELTEAMRMQAEQYERAQQQAMSVQAEQAREYQRSRQAEAERRERQYAEDVARMREDQARDRQELTGALRMQAEKYERAQQQAMSMQAEQFERAREYERSRQAEQESASMTRAMEMMRMQQQQDRAQMQEQQQAMSINQAQQMQQQFAQQQQAQQQFAQQQYAQQQAQLLAMAQKQQAQPAIVQQQPAQQAQPAPIVIMQTRKEHGRHHRRHHGSGHKKEHRREHGEHGKGRRK